MEKFDKINDCKISRRPIRPFFTEEHDDYVKIVIRPEDANELGIWNSLNIAIKYVLASTGYEKSFVLRERNGVIEIIVE